MDLIFSLKYNWQYIEKAPAICLIEKPQYWLLSKRIDLCTYRVWASWRLCAGSGARWCTAGRRGSRRPGSRRRPRGCPGCTGTRTCTNDDLFRCTSMTTPKNERAYGKLLFAPKQSLVTCFRQSVRLSLRHLSSAAAGKSQPNKLKCLSRES